MPETLTDEQILGLEDGPSSEVSSGSAETSESTATIETQPEQTAEETEFAPDQAKPETLTQAKPQDKTQQPAKQQTENPATTPEAQTIEAKAAELDRADAAFASGDVAGMAQTFEEMFGENPGACADALWMGLRFLESRSPEHLSNFSRMVVSDELGQQGIWNALEIIYESAQKAGAQETLALLDQLAGGLRHTYGVGPATPETQTAEWQNYTRNVGAMMDRDVPAAIARAFGPRFSAVTPANQEELIKAANLEIGDRLSKDKTVTAALQKLNQTYSVKEGVRIYFDVIEPRVRSLVSMIAPHLANQYADLFKTTRPQTRLQSPQRPAQRPAPQKPRSMAEYGAEGKTLGDITREVLGELDEANPLQAGSDEARGMSDLDILNSNRAGQRRAPWRPGNELDEATL